MGETALPGGRPALCAPAGQSVELLRARPQHLFSRIWYYHHLGTLLLIRECGLFHLKFNAEKGQVYRTRTLKSSNDSDEGGGAPWEKCDFEKSTSAEYAFLVPYIALILILFIGKQLNIIIL